MGEYDVDALPRTDVVESASGALYEGRVAGLLPGDAPRRQAIAIVESVAFDRFVLGCIVLNCVLLELQGPLKGVEAATVYFKASYLSFQVIFTVEMALKMLASGITRGRDAYLRNYWNWLDITVVVTGWLPYIVPGTGNMSVLRVMRALRPLRTIKRMPGIRTIVDAMVSAAPGLANVILLLTFILVLFAVLGMQLFKGTQRFHCVDAAGHPPEDLWEVCRPDYLPASAVEASRSAHKPSRGSCPAGQVCVEGANPDHGAKSFDDFGAALMTVFQVVTLEGWGDVMRMEMAAVGQWAWVYFGTLVVLGAIFVLNLLRAVIIEKFGDPAPQDGPKSRATSPAMSFSTSMTLSRSVTRAVGWRSRKTSKGPPRTPTEASRDGSRAAPAPSGPTTAPGSQPSLWARARSGARRLVNSQAFDRGVLAAVVANTVILCCYYHGMPPRLLAALEACNDALAAVFLAEMAAKLMAWGFRAYWSDAFNRFDGFVVGTSLVELLFLALGSRASVNLSSLRAFRLFRVLKLLRAVPGTRRVVSMMSKSLSLLESLCVLSALTLLVFAMLGEQLFGGALAPGAPPEDTPREHFDDLPHALLTTFVVTTGEGWTDIYANAMAVAPRAAAAYFTALVVVANYVLLNLIIAILLTNVSDADDDDDEEEDGDSFKGGAGAGEGREAAGRAEAGGSVAVLEALPGDGRHKDSGSLARISESRAAGPHTVHSPHKARRADERADRWGRMTHSRAPGRDGQREGLDLCVPCGRRRFLGHGKSSGKRQASGKGQASGSREPSASRQPWADGPFPPLPGRELSRSAGGPAAAEADRSGKEALARKQVTAMIRRQQTSVERLGGSAERRGWCCGWEPAWVSRARHRDLALGCLPRSHPVRALALRAVSSFAFDRAMLGVILVSAVAVALHPPTAEARAAAPRLTAALAILDPVISAAFCLELAAKVLAQGLFYPVPPSPPPPTSPAARHAASAGPGDSVEAAEKTDTAAAVAVPGAYLRDPWNRLDACIVLATVLADLLSHLRWLRVLQAARTLRPLRLMARHGGTKLVINSLLLTLPAVSSVLVICALFVVIFSALGVQLFGGAFAACTDPAVVSEAACVGTYYDAESGALVARHWVNPPFGNFDSVPAAALLLFEIANLEGWTEPMWRAVDSQGAGAAPRRDANLPAALFFVAWICVGGFFAVNLFIGVIVDRFNAYKKHADGELFMTQQQKAWVKLQASMLSTSAVQRPERPEGSRLRAAAYDLVTNARFEAAIAGVIGVVLLCAVVDGYDQPAWTAPAVEAVGVATVAVFLIEAVLKIYAFSFAKYITNGWDRFDFVVLLVSMANSGLALASISVTAVSPMLLRLLRLARAARLLRLTRTGVGMRALMTTAVTAVPALANVVVLLALLLFVAAVVGVRFFCRVEDGEVLTATSSFATLPKALLLLFECSTGETWNSVMHTLMRAREEGWCGDVGEGGASEEEVGGVLEGCFSMAAVPYFCIFTITSTLITLNIVIAIVVDAYEETQAEVQAQTVTPDHVEGFREAWASVDPNATGRALLLDLPQVIWRTPYPLGLEDYPGLAALKPRTGAMRFVHELDALHTFLDKSSADHAQSAWVLYLEVLDALIARVFPDVTQEQLASFEQMSKRVEQYMQAKASLSEKIMGQALADVPVEHRVMESAGRVYAAERIQQRWRERKRAREDARRRSSVLNRVSDTGAKVLAGLRNSPMGAGPGWRQEASLAATARQMRA